MKTTLPTLCVAVGMVLTASATCGAEPFQLEKGFVRLDNGKDLSGWTNVKACWSVRDGAIHVDGASRQWSNIYSEKKHSRNAVIRLQFRASPGADSGVFIHGAQFQVRDYPGSLPDTKPYAPYAKPAGQWNDLEFDITEGVAVVKLNGHVIEKHWRIGNQPDVGLGLQKEKGDFDFRYIRIHEKQKR